MKSTFIALAAGAALALAGAAQAAEGFNILFGGSSWNVPSCAQGKVLREVRDAQSGKTVWRCVLPADQTAQAVAPVQTAQAAVPRRKPEQAVTAVPRR